MKSPTMFRCVAYHIPGEYTSRTIVALGPYTANSRGWGRANTIAANRLLKAFPDAWTIDVAIWDEELHGPAPKVATCLDQCGRYLEATDRRGARPPHLTPCLPPCLKK